jgi:hypothetical protein
MESPVVGWLWPAWWQEEPEDPSPLEIASELAGLDAESPEHWEALFYGLLDLDDEGLVKAYLERL